ncbi:DJ-1/PfpI family protein [Flavobacterium sp.]|uniref:DJ-1/PfpI family protein n=1 Tax=Flavobacterium sp. TaxID=239 RepID=UPI0026356AE6|nr:DJ-1/PfpI family protein [Flavobacterium sp.]
MEQIMRTLKITLSVLLMIAAAALALFFPVLSYGQAQSYHGAKIENWKAPQFDENKKTVFVIADGKLTEMFDMLAPFYVFNATEQLNVYIVAKDDTPIPLKRDLYVLQQLTFAQVEARHLKADVIVIPAMSARDEKQDPVIVDFIKSHYGPTTRIISICDGASTAAATGLYDGKLITCHATDFECVKKYWSKPIWTQNRSVTKSDRVYSTAGVANAVDGSLMVVEDLLGKDAMVKAAKAVNYPHAEVQIEHKSDALTFGNKLSILRKMVFSRKRKLGLLLHDGLNELKFASIVDTYGRTYPKEFKTFTLQDSIVKTKYGLTFIHVGDNTINPKMDEVHVVMPELLSAKDEAYFKGFEMVKHNNTDYPINQCIKRIAQQSGEHYAYIVKLTLDYN